MHKFKELSVWQKSRALVKEIYLVVKKFPEEERFGLISQITRSAISVPSNIAEGCGRGTNKDFRYFLIIARGSCNELETQLILANDLDFLETKVFLELEQKTIEIGKMLNALIRSIETK